MFYKNLLLLALLCPALSFAEPLTLEDAMRQAQSAQPLVESQMAAARADSERGIADNQLPDPKLKLGLVNVPYAPFSLTREPMTQAMIGIEQMFPGGDKRRIRGEVAQANANQKIAQSADINRSIRLAAGLAWLDAWYPQQAVKKIAVLKQEYQYQIEAEHIRVATNKGEQKDVLAVQIQLEMLQDKAAELREQEAKARAEMLRWGVDAENLELAQTLPVFNAAITPDQLSAHPKINAVDQSIVALGKEVDLAKEASKPDWSVEVGYGARGAGQTDMLSVQFGIELPIYKAQRQDRQLAAKLAERDAMQSTRDDQLRQLQAGLQSAMAEHQSLQSRISRFENTIIPVAAQRTQAALVSYRNGKADLTVVLESRRAELDVGLQMLALQAASAKAALQIDSYMPEGAQ